ncbi:division/cell wall cluster transcriptional repressor MraZ [Bdellovibrionales bacterium]|nr:division/cell wall cluster transcriptional repressor MraZ [Bdellovibrionales bacterium]
MTAFFRGRYEVRIDSKGRFIIPSNYRQAFEAAELIQEPIEFVVTNSQSQGHPCLDLYPLEEWERLEGEIARLPRFKQEVVSFRRFYLACSQVVKSDTQNRLLLPAHMREYALLSDEVILLGMGRKFEIWSLPVWQEIHKELAESFDSVLENLSGVVEVMS